MKLKSTIDIPSFLKAVQNCRDEVLFITAEGDELNLKSTLSQFVFAAVCVDDLRGLKGFVQIENAQDTAALSEYLSAENEMPEVTAYGTD